MPNYKKMYFALFNAVTDVIHDLQKAQMEGEESYIENKDFPISILSASTEKEETGTD